jgi:hypothetical protein
VRGIACVDRGLACALGTVMTTRVKRMLGTRARGSVLGGSPTLRHVSAFVERSVLTWCPVSVNVTMLARSDGAAGSGGPRR